MLYNTNTTPIASAIGRETLTTKVVGVSALFIMPPTKKKVIVYIDSWNLYYGSLNNRGIGYKWLNIECLVKKIFPKYDIKKIKFFTAKSSGKNDPTKPARQAIFFRALRTLPILEIIEGVFLFNVKSILTTTGKRVLAEIPEEKGTDVNLAVHLVNDAHNKEFDTAIIVSNDSDFAEAVRIVTQELKLEVGILSPFRKSSKKLCKNASFIRKIRKGAVMSSQFSEVLVDKNGTFSKPPSW